MNRIWFGVLIGAILVSGALFLKSRSRNPSVQEGSVSVFDLSIVSFGHVNMVDAGGRENLTIETTYSHPITFRRSPQQNLVEIEWKPEIKFKMNGRTLKEQEELLSLIPNQRMLLELTNQGLPKTFFYQSLPELPPAAAEIVLNMGRMILLQLMMDENSTHLNRGIDYWGDTFWNWKNSKELSTTSAEKTQSGIQGKGTFELKFDSHGEIESLSGEQSTNPSISKSLGDSVVKYSISRKDRKSAPDLVLSIDGFEADVPWVQVQSKSMMRATFMERTKGWSLERIDKELQSLVLKKATTVSELAGLSEKLQQLLFLDPQLAEKISLWAMKLGPAHPFFNEILKALTWVGDENCQRAIVSLVEHYRNDSSSVTKVLIAAAFVKTPTPQIQAELESIISNPVKPSVGATAELLLGQMAYQLIESDPSRAQEIESRFLNELKDAQAPEQTKKALDEIGNSGLCSDYDSLIKWAHQPDPSLAAAAYDSIRYCKNSRAGRDLLNGFLQNTGIQAKVLASIEMRIQRGIYDDETFIGLYQWLTNQGWKSDLKKPVYDVLIQLSRNQTAAQSQMEELKRNCSAYQLCGL